ncbi:MAG: NifU N-terminal domain-containing protein, partial [Flavobacteriales bacterium]|nr:NifU N-terminal domain-containing protein [Flavobacteriales bacterium]
MEKHIIKFKETSREEELEFYSNIFLSEKRIEFEKIEETNEFPLIQQIFYLPFIKKVILNKHSVYIEKLNILKWEDVQEELCSQLEEFLNKGGLVSKDEIKKVSPVTVYAESTPNPNAMKFVVNKKIVDDVYEFKSVDDTKDCPLAKSLFGFEFIKEVFFDFNFVSLIQKQGNNWDENVMDVREFIRSFIQDNNTIVFEDRIKSQIKTKSNVEFDDITKEIIKIIDENIKPAVASDG